jgi:hypothetical protein
MKLWSLLESEFHKLDLQLAQHSRGKAGDREGYVKYADLIHKIAQLQDEHHHLSELAAMIDGVVTTAALQLGDDEQVDPQILELHREAIHVREQITTFCCQQFVGTSITPKLHVIKDYTMDFFRKWRVGCGLLGE